MRAAATGRRSLLPSPSSPLSAFSTFYGSGRGAGQGAPPPPDPPHGFPGHLGPPPPPYDAPYGVPSRHDTGHFVSGRGMRPNRGPDRCSVGGGGPPPPYGPPSRFPGSPDTDHFDPYRGGGFSGLNPANAPFPSLVSPVAGRGKSSIPSRSVEMREPDFAEPAQEWSDHGFVHSGPIGSTGDSFAESSQSGPVERSGLPDLSAPKMALLRGGGRGAPTASQQAPEVPEENRHIRRRAAPPPPLRPPSQQSQVVASMSVQPKLSPEEAKNRAINVLSRGGPEGPQPAMGRRRGLGRGRGRGSMEEKVRAFLGADVDGEKLLDTLGPEKMKLLTKAFEDAAAELPSTEGAYIDTLYTNNEVEFEPEHVLNFDNPNIDDDNNLTHVELLEKCKPFLTAHEGSQSQEECEGAVQDLMKTVPAVKELINKYSRTDTAAAKQQEKELQRVARTLPKRAPSSVKGFSDRALLSLKSNPGWSFDKKYQFMKKLVGEVQNEKAC